MSHRPASYLRRCQQTGPHAGSTAEVPEAGREEHVGIMGVMTTQSDTHTQDAGVPGREAGSRVEGPLTALSLEEGLGHVSQAPSCARPGFAPAQSSGIPGMLVAHWANTHLTPPSKPGPRGLPPWPSQV